MACGVGLRVSILHGTVWQEDVEVVEEEEEEKEDKTEEDDDADGVALFFAGGFETRVIVYTGPPRPDVRYSMGSSLNFRESNRIACRKRAG